MELTFTNVHPPLKQEEKKNVYNKIDTAETIPVGVTFFFRPSAGDALASSAMSFNWTQGRRWESALAAGNVASLKCETTAGQLISIILAWFCLVERLKLCFKRAVTSTP